MRQASRIAIIGLLTLLQCFAPLVHAHAGGGPFSGAIHVPGLEFLTKANGKFAQAFTHEACTGVIVGLATGLRDQANETNAASDTGFDLPPKLFIAAGLPSSQASHPPISEFAPALPFWLPSTPRAPPSPTC